MKYMIKLSVSSPFHQIMFLMKYYCCISQITEVVECYLLCIKVWNCWLAIDNPFSLVWICYQLLSISPPVHVCMYMYICVCVILEKIF